MAKLTTKFAVLIAVCVLHAALPQFVWQAKAQDSEPVDPKEFLQWNPPELLDKFFRDGPTDRAKLGKILDPIRAKATGMNFELCDKSLAKVDIDSIVLVNEICPDEDPFGPLTITDFKSGVVFVYSKEYVPLGKLVGWEETNEGKLIARLAATSDPLLPGTKVAKMTDWINDPSNVWVSGGSSGVPALVVIALPPI